MSELETLRNKWFLDVEGSSDVFPPQNRHSGALVAPYTDGNLVEPILDGATYMAFFYDQMQAMVDSPVPEQNQLWIASWRIEPVQLLGADQAGPDAMTFIADAAASGVQVYYLGSGHISAHGNASKFAQRVNAAGGQGASDRRMPRIASHHQKFNVFRGPDNYWMATLGSGDLLFARYDTYDCNDVEPKRPEKGYSTHDVWLKLQGPAVHDVALHFAERWNDKSNRQLTEPQIATSIQLDFRDEPIPSAGTHSLQLLRTYAIEPKRGYSWSHQGEFTIWAAYLNAIRKAQRYIYLEDQYFYIFEDPPAIGSTGLKRESDLVYQLGEAVKRGVDVLVVFPSRKGDIRKHYERQQRGWAMTYLREISQSSPDAGKVLGAYLSKGDMDPIIHSKLMLVDDEYAIVGSANIGQRSMAHDSEVSFGMVDAAGELVRNLRVQLWAKHMEVADPVPLVDVDQAIEAMFESAETHAGRLRAAPDQLAKYRFRYGFVMNRIIDPYAGPPRE